MNKRILIPTAIAAALIGTVAFASNQVELDTASPITQPVVSSQTGAPVPTAADAPRNAPEAPRATESTDPAQAPSAPEETAVAAEIEAQPEAPVTPPVPIVVIKVIGSNVSSNARAGIDTFTCTYYLSDGTSVSRETQYIAVPSSMPAAVCPDYQ